MELKQRRSPCPPVHLAKVKIKRVLKRFLFFVCRFFTVAGGLCCRGVWMFTLQLLWMFDFCFAFPCLFFFFREVTNVN